MPAGAAVSLPSVLAVGLVGLVALKSGDLGRLADPVISASLIVAATALFAALRFGDALGKSAAAERTRDLSRLSDEAARALADPPLGRPESTDRSAA